MINGRTSPNPLPKGDLKTYISANIIKLPKAGHKNSPLGRGLGDVRPYSKEIKSK